MRNRLISKKRLKKTKVGLREREVAQEFFFSRITFASASLGGIDDSRSRIALLQYFISKFVQCEVCLKANVYSNLFDLTFSNCSGSNHRDSSQIRFE